MEKTIQEPPKIAKQPRIFILEILNFNYKKGGKPKRQVQPIGNGNKEKAIIEFNAITTKFISLIKKDLAVFKLIEIDHRVAEKFKDTETINETEQENNDFIRDYGIMTGILFCSFFCIAEGEVEITKRMPALKK